MEVWENDAVGARAARGSKLQPQDAGIIAHWKVLYRKRMLQYVCSQVDGEVRTELLYDDLHVQLVSDTSIDDDYDKRCRTIINQEPCRSLVYNGPTPAL